jgi:glutathione S-transferase
MKMSNVAHKFNEVDTFTGNFKDEEYDRINPTGSLPTLKEGKFVVLGGYQVFINFLTQHHRSVHEKLRT